MKVAVVGAGAMGCRFGAALGESGRDVTLVDPWLAHVQAMQRQGGLLVDDEQGTRLVKLKATTPEASTEQPDLIIVFGKAMQTERLITAVAHLIGPSTVVLTLQNGLGNVETISTVVPRERIVAGVTTIGTELLGPGHVRSLGDGSTQVMQVDGASGASSTTVLDAFAGSAIAVTESSDVATTIWQKVAFNAVLNTLCTLACVPVSALRSYPEFPDLADAVIEEIVQVGAAEGVVVDKAAVWATIVKATDPTMSGHHLPSMLQDLLSQRPTEIDYLNGAVVRRGARHDIPTPVNTVIAHLVRLAEATRSERVTSLHG